MKRRDFTLMTLGAGAAVALHPTAALANLERDEAPRDVFERVALTVGGVNIVAAWLLLHFGSQILGVDLRQPVPRYDEQRVDLGGVPVLGSLMRPTLDRRFGQSRRVGAVALYGSEMIVLPETGNLGLVQQVVIAHREFSWEPPGRPRPVTVPGLGDIPQLRGLTRIGHARATERELLILIRPTITGFDERD